MAMITVTIDDELLKIIEKRAQDEHRSRSNMIEKMLLEDVKTFGHEGST